MAKNIAHLYEKFIRKHVEFNLHLCIRIDTSSSFIAIQYLYLHIEQVMDLHLTLCCIYCFNPKLQVIVPLVVMCDHWQFYVMNHLQKCL